VIDSVMAAVPTATGRADYRRRTSAPELGISEKRYDCYRYAMMELDWLGVIADATL